MENDVVTLVGEAAEQAAHLSFFDLFWQADWVVKLVIITLIGCSVVCWAAIFHKYSQLLRIRRSAHKFERLFWSGTSIPGLVKTIGDSPKNPLENILLRSYDEWKRSNQQIELGKADMVMSRIGSLARIAIDQEQQRLSKHLSMLASMGSACPFIGLFGTVWGIMNSFSAIALSKQTSLTVVAPGIAEALFATALGLIAAIPATLAYNKFVNQIDQIGQNSEMFAAEVLAILSRQINTRA